MPGAKPKNQPGADDNDEKDDIENPDDDQNPDDSDDEGADDGDEDDGEELDAKAAKSLIKKLRAENAKHRNKNKELSGKVSNVEAKLDGLKKALGVGGEDDESPEDKIKKLQAEKEQLQMEHSLAELSREHEIPKQHDKYFRYLLAEKFDGLSDGEELSDEDIQEVVEQVKALGTGSAPGKGSTGLNNNGGRRAPSKGDEITVEQFAKMNTGEKSALYVKNPALYKTLFDGAVEKRLL